MASRRVLPDDDCARDNCGVRRSRVEEDRRMSSTIEEGVGHGESLLEVELRRRPPRSRAPRARPRCRSSARPVAHRARDRARRAHAAAPRDDAAVAQRAEDHRVACRRGRVVVEDAREEASRLAPGNELPGSAQRWRSPVTRPGSPGACVRASPEVVVVLVLVVVGGGGDGAVVVGGGAVVVGGGVVVVGGGGRGRRWRSRAG